MGGVSMESPGLSITAAAVDPHLCLFCVCISVSFCLSPSFVFSLSAFRIYAYLAVFRTVCMRGFVAVSVCLLFVFSS